MALRAVPSAETRGEKIVHFEVVRMLSDSVRGPLLLAYATSVHLE
jgi:hypothetical protein